MTSSPSPPLRLHCPTERMKVSMAALFLLVLILTISSVSHSQKIVESVNIPHYCCLKYREKPIPRKLVVGYLKAFNCHLPAIIFITKKNREICANPNSKWAQDYIKDPNLPLLSPKEPRFPG